MPSIGFLIGRESEVAAVTSSLADADVRLLCLAGGSGSGKSALLRALLRGCVPTDRTVWVADLGATAGGDFAAELARTLDVRAGADPLARLIEVIGSRRLLLAIDHAEQRPDRASVLAALLAACPHLLVVVASVNPTGIEGERVLRLGPLGTPAESSVASVTGSASGQLFVARARLIDPRFRVEPGNSVDVARICRLLGGLPLLLELAAARVGIGAPALRHLLESHASVLDLLTPLSAEPARYGPRASVRSALGWSCSLLPPGERRLLRQIAAFVGPLTVSAAVQVAGPGVGLGEVLDRLGALVDLALVEPVPSAPGTAGEPVFRVLPVIRRYVLDELPGDEPDDVAPSVDARRAYLVPLARRAAQAVAECAEDEAIEHVQVMRRDLLAVLDDLQAGDPVPLARLAVDAAAALNGLAEQGSVGAVLDPLITSGRVEALDAGLQAEVLLWSSALLAWSPHGGSVTQLISERWQRGIALAQEVDDPLVLLQGYLLAVLSAPTTRDFRTGAVAAERGRELAASLGHASWQGRFDTWRAMLAHASGDIPRAAELGVASLRQGQRLDDTVIVVGSTLLLRTLPEGSVRGIDALPTLEQAHELCATSSLAVTDSFVLAALAGRALDEGDIGGAAHWCRLRLDVMQRLGWQHSARLSLLHTAMIGLAAGDAELTARLLGCVRVDEERLLSSLPPRRRAEFGRLVATVSARVGAARFDVLTAQGSLWTLGEASTRAIAWLEERRDLAPPRASDDVGPVARSSERLSPRELEVLALLTQGLTNREIGAALHLSVKTVMHHSGAIYRKLGVRGRAEATAYAVRHGLVADPAP